MAPPKPRRYDGPVGWLDQARDAADAWDDLTLAQVAGLFPYSKDRGVRLMDWIELVAHIAGAQESDPVETAQRLADFAQTVQAHT